MSFTEIDMKTWKRAAAFRHFTQTVPIQMSATVKIDVTKLLNTCRKHNIKFSAAMLWIVTVNINKDDAFKVGEKNGKFVIFDEMNSAFPVFHSEDNSMTHLWIEHDASFKSFYANYIRIVEAYGNERRFNARRDKLRPENVFPASSIPWLSFESFSVHSVGEKILFCPEVEWGKYTTDENGKTVMPMSLTIHHAVADGWNLANFFQNVQISCDSFTGE